MNDNNDRTDAFMALMVVKVAKIEALLATLLPAQMVSLTQSGNSRDDVCDTLAKSYAESFGQALQPLCEADLEFAPAILEAAKKDANPFLRQS